MNTEILKSIIFNVGLLVLIAQVLAKIGFVKKYILHDMHNPKEQVLLVILFSAVCIISNYTGYKVNGAYANTRVIGVMASAYIGGPWVGIMTAIIAGTHRLLMDINSLSSVACFISTIVEGIFAASCSKEVKKLKYDSTMLFGLTFVAEIMQMFIIMLVAKPYVLALQLVSSIAVPMVLFNSIGMVFFVSVFKSVFVEHEQVIGEKLKLTFEITERCIPLLRTGLYDETNCRGLGDIILTFYHNQGVLFTDTERILSSNGNLTSLSWINKEIPEIVKQVLTENTVCVNENAPEGDALYDVLQKLTAIGAPLTKEGQPFGCMVIFVRSYKISFQSDIEFVNGLSKLFSLQYELSEKDKQKELLQKAEYQSLQSQINPHFIFNALNTISTFCREKPEMARELLIALATYFRKSIQIQNTFVSLHEEMQYVNAYLQIEKARFDDRLEIIIDIRDNLECRMPYLILQPIVENAVVHGAMKRRHGVVKITAKEMGNEVMISVADNGYGIEQEIIDAIMENKLDSSHMYGRGTDMSTGATSMVGIISRGFMGSIGGLFAIAGVIVLPITSGDTAFRALRLMIAEQFKIDQKSWGKRVGLSLLIFIPALAILFYAKSNAAGFSLLWRYFGFTNQLVATFALALITVYLKSKKQNPLITLIPGMFYSFIVTSYICHADIGFGLEERLGKVIGIGADSYVISYTIGVLVAILYGWGITKIAVKRKEKILATKIE